MQQTLEDQVRTLREQNPDKDPLIVKALLKKGYKSDEIVGAFKAAKTQKPVEQAKPKAEVDIYSSGKNLPLSQAKEPMDVTTSLGKFKPEDMSLEQAIQIVQNPNIQAVAVGPPKYSKSAEMLSKIASPYLKVAKKKVSEEMTRQAVVSKNSDVEEALIEGKDDPRVEEAIRNHYGFKNGEPIDFTSKIKSPEDPSQLMRVLHASTYMPIINLPWKAAGFGFRAMGTEPRGYTFPIYNPKYYEAISNPDMKAAPERGEAYHFGAGIDKPVLDWAVTDSLELATRGFSRQKKMIDGIKQGKSIQQIQEELALLPALPEKGIIPLAQVRGSMRSILPSLQGNAPGGAWFEVIPGNALPIYRVSTKMDFEEMAKAASAPLTLGIAEGMSPGQVLTRQMGLNESENAGLVSLLLDTGFALAGGAAVKAFNASPSAPGTFLPGKQGGIVSERLTPLEMAKESPGLVRQAMRANAATEELAAQQSKALAKSINEDNSAMTAMRKNIQEIQWKEFSPLAKAVSEPKPLPGVPKSESFKIDLEQTQRSLIARTKNGIVSGEIRSDGVHIKGAEVRAGQQGQGVGTALYTNLIDEAHSQGLNVFSDSVVEAPAVKMYQKLESMGYKVTKNPNAKASKGGTLSIEGGADIPVFEVGPKKSSGFPGAEELIPPEQVYAGKSDKIPKPKPKKIIEPSGISPLSAISTKAMRARPTVAENTAGAINTASAADDFAAQRGVLRNTFGEITAEQMVPTATDLVKVSDFSGTGGSLDLALRNWAKASGITSLANPLLQWSVDRTKLFIDDLTKEGVLGLASQEGFSPFKMWGTAFGKLLRNKDAQPVLVRAYLSDIAANQTRMTLLDRSYKNLSKLPSAYLENNGEKFFKLFSREGEDLSLTQVLKENPNLPKSVVEVAKRHLDIKRQDLALINLFRQSRGLEPMTGVQNFFTRHLFDGDYVVLTKAPNGKARLVGNADTMAGAEKLREQMLASGAGGDGIYIRERVIPNEAFVNMTLERRASLLEQYAKIAKLDDAAKEELYRAAQVLRENEKFSDIAGLLKKEPTRRGIAAHRKGEAGYSNDLILSEGAYYQSIANFIHKTGVREEFTAVANKLRMASPQRPFLAQQLEEIADNAFGVRSAASIELDQALINGPLRPLFSRIPPGNLERALRGIRALNFYSYLGLPKFRAVNATQILTNVMPSLEVKYWNSALTEFFTEGGQQILKEENLYTTRGKFGDVVSDKWIKSGYEQATQGDVPGLFRRLAQFGKENHVQGSAFLAWRKKALDLGMQEPEARATAHLMGRLNSAFEASKFDPLLFAKGEVGRTLQQFGRFGIKDVEQATSALTAKDLPTLIKWTFAKVLVGGIGFYLPLKYRESIKKEFGDFADAILHGIGSGLGVDLSRSYTIWPLDILFNISRGNWNDAMAGAILGPANSTANEIMTGLLSDTRDDEEFSSVLTRLQAKNPLVRGMAAMKRVYDRIDDPDSEYYIKTPDGRRNALVTLRDDVLMSLGFKSLQVSKVNEISADILEVMRKEKETRTKVLDLLEDGKFKDAWQTTQDFNATYGMASIPDDFDQMMGDMMRRSLNKDKGAFEREFDRASKPVKIKMIEEIQRLPESNPNRKKFLDYASDWALKH